jgi:ubiquitin carboxyl-terminal hydrolase 9/13
MAMIPHRMKIKKLPNVLALHLKRFKYQEELKKYIKLTYRVAFPFELRLFNTVDDVEDPDRLYELFGIVVHIGRYGVLSVRGVVYCILKDSGCSGPHHGHYVAIVRGPHSWLIFDDDKIEPIKESEVPRYFGDAASGSAYVLYYQAVDLDPASLGIKPPAPPAAPEVAVAGASASPAAVATNGAPLSEPPEPALPPGLGEPSTPPPAPVPAAAPAPHPPVPAAPSSPSLIAPPLVASATLPARKKSLPSLRIPGTSDLSSTIPTTPNRAHGGLFHALRSSPSSSRIRPSTSEGISPRSPMAGIPPVPPVPLQFFNGREHAKEKEKERDKSSEREEGRLSKEFDRKPGLWFRRRSFKPAKDERGKEKERDIKGKDNGVSAAPVPTVPLSQATTSATVLSTTLSQSDAASSTSGGTSLWRRSSARLGYHVKRLSATYSSTTLGEPDATVISGSPPGLSSMPHPQRPRQLSAVPATPQSLHPDQESSTPTTSASGSPTFPPAPSQHRTPPPAPDADGEADVDAPGGRSLPAWRISPASPPGPSRQGTTTSTVPHHASEPSSTTDDNNDADDEHQHRRMFSALLARRSRGRPHSVHGSGSGTPRERSTSSHEPRLPLAASAAESGSTTLLSGSLANGVSSPTASMAQERGKEKEPAKLRRGTRKLSFHAPMFGLGFGLGLGGREKDREKERDHLGKKEDGKKPHKMHPPSAFGASAAVASTARS